MRQWKLMTGRVCDELRMAWVMTYVLPVIATRRFSPRLRTSDNGNRVTDRWRKIVTKTSNGIREGLGKIPPRSNKQRDTVVKTRRRQRAGVSLCGDLCYDSSTTITNVPLTHRALTVPRYQILHVLNRLFLYSCSKPEHPSVGDHSCTTRNRSRNLCCDSWSLSHLGYLYPGTTPVMIKLDHNRSCPWV